MKNNRLTAEQLRKSVLQLAIQGKLVKQNPNDEPTSVLVEKIYAEKEKLIAEGKIKKDKNESRIFKGEDNRYYEKVGNEKPVDITDDLPFDIPDSWAWIRQKNICWLNNGIKQKGISLPYLEAKVIRGHKKPDYLNEGIIVNELCRVILVDGENSGEIMQPPYEGYMGSTFKIFASVKNFCYEYLLVFFELNKELYKNSKVGAAIPHLNKNLFKELFVPVPPLEEQQRIVEKIEFLTPCINQYEKVENELFELDSTIKEKLKKSILQYAIQGKLVKQDPNDEPASVLLERIKSEKEQLIKEGKIKRDKNESVIYQGDDKNYYENLPQGWMCCYMSNAVDVRDGTHESPKYYSQGKPFISSKNLYDGKIDYQNIKYISYNDFEKYNYRSNAEENDILFGMIGTIGNPAIITDPPYKFAFKNMALIKTINNLMNYKYIYYYVKFIENTLNKKSFGAVQKFVSLDFIRKYPLIVPPLNEQSKIVNKLDEIIDFLNF